MKRLVWKGENKIKKEKKMIKNFKVEGKIVQKNKKRDKLKYR